MTRARRMTSDERLAVRDALHAAADAGQLSVARGVSEMRRALGLSQGAFGRRFGLTRRQVSELERDLANPTAETLEKIGRPFGLVAGFVRTRPDAVVTGATPLFPPPQLSGKR
jgi:putative transcriptional regulator